MDYFEENLWLGTTNGLKLFDLKSKKFIENKITDLLNNSLIFDLLVLNNFIFIGSEASLKGNHKSTLYSAAKHGLLGFVKSFREECNKSDIRVTIINPGMVNSSFFKKFN